MTGYELIQQMLAGPMPENGACLEWPRCKDRHGYGGVGVGGKRQLVHRVAFVLANGPLAQDVRVLHRCDNPACFRPDHLFPGSQADNMRDMAVKGRAVCKLTEADVREIRHVRSTGATQQALADRFGVSQFLISQICRGQAWRHGALSGVSF